MPMPLVLSATSIIGDKVRNAEGEDLGEIQELMIDLSHGSVAYAVLTFGGFLGLGNKLFAIPWQALTLDQDHKQFILNVDKASLKDAPGFDKDHWPEMTLAWATTIHEHYGYPPYWGS